MWDDASKSPLFNVENCRSLSSSYKVCQEFTRSLHFCNGYYFLHTSIISSSNTITKTNRIEAGMYLLGICENGKDLKNF
jgi:hypothetical protein